MANSTELQSLHPLLDVIYVTASAHDSRFTRICIASIRYFYPDVPIRLLAGGKLVPGLAEELNHFWNVPLSNFTRGDWGWGFIKLEPLFSGYGERFLVLDSDTVFSGPVLSAFSNPSYPFVVDDESHTETSANNIYYEWRKLSTIGFPSQPPEFLFNTGQWLGTAGILKREEFAQFIDWNQLPPSLKYPGIFKNGEQGVLNYILNQNYGFNSTLVSRLPLMHWPGHGMDQFSAISIANRVAPARILHWAGFKSPRLHSLPGSDILQFFEVLYYSKLPYGAIRRRILAMWMQVTYWFNGLRVILSLRMRKYFRAKHVKS